MRVLFDTCVILDVLQKREPFFELAQNLILAVANENIEGIATAKSLTDIYYILRRGLQEEKVRTILRTILELFAVAETTASDCELALLSPMQDYEDAVMVETGKRIGADCIVTRNTKDYAVATKIKVVSPEDLSAYIFKLS